MKTHIIIPAFEGLSYLKILIPKLFSEIPKNCEITVVDNGSTDGTLPWLITQPINIIHNKQNLGFAVANNQAAQYRKSKYLLFLNQDIEPEPQFLNYMYLQMLPGVAIVGARIIQKTTGQLHHAGITFLTDGSDKGMPVEYCRGCDPQIPAVMRDRECDAVTAACMLIRTDVFCSLGGFSTDYINGWEDNDLCCRIREHNWKIRYACDALIYHVVESAPGRHEHEYNNRNLFKQKWIDSGRIFKILNKNQP